MSALQDNCRIRQIANSRQTVCDLAGQTCGSRLFLETAPNLTRGLKTNGSGDEFTANEYYCPFLVRHCPPIGYTIA